jgi:hypothetical protein
MRRETRNRRDTEPAMCGLSFFVLDGVRRSSTPTAPATLVDR